MSHLSYTRAQSRVHARQSLGSLPGVTTLASIGPDIPLPCSDSDGAPPSTPVSNQSDYRVHGVSRSLARY